MTEQMRNRKVMVVGGGFAGMTAAMLLADRGHDVCLVEREAAVGGFFPLLDNTFPTNSCGVCFLSPRQPAYCPFIECRRRDRIEVRVNSRPVAVTGTAGDFTVRLAVVPRGVDQEKCIDCGLCTAACPVEVPDEFSGGLEKRRAIYKQFPKLVAGGYRVDYDACTRCGACVTACPTGAVDLDLPAREEEVQVGAVLLTPGFSLVPGDLNGEYGFGRYSNVITSRQMERLISASGPTSGVPAVPSSGKPPKKVAFIQCVGSRDQRCGRGHCSAVCCMYAAKQAMFLKKRLPDTDVSVFYMDLRGMGKGYERYFWEAEDAGIRFRRSLISTVKEDPRTRNLRLVAEDDGRRTEEEFDLVVLSLGFDAGTVDLGADMRLEQVEGGFFKVDEFAPGVSSVPGIYVAGACTGPRDIPETVMDAAAAADVLDVACGSTGDTQLAPAPAPGAENAAAPPRIGVFLCRCGGLLDEQLDFGALSAALKGEPGVEYVEVIDRACDPEGFGPVCRALGEHDLNRVVFGACSAREMGWKTDAFARETGMNPHWFASANLRDQCSLVHLSDPQAAAAKALHLLQAAIAGVRLTAGVERHKTTITPRALVVGGGVAGMTAALSLADRGYPVTLVERAGHLGGRLLEASFYTIAGNDPQRLVADLVARTTGHDNIAVRTGVEVIGHRGRPGNFVTVIAGGEADEEMIHHGVVILATGGREAKTEEYLAGRHAAVLTQSALEGLVHKGDARLDGVRRVVMIQCVGSRERGGREYCSRVCCTHALKNARRLKELNPEIEITVLYRDLRAYGLYEHDYRQVRELGVLFTPYTVDEKPTVSAAGDQVTVSWRDRILQRPMTVAVDLLVLSTGVEANDTDELALIFDVPRDDHGFYAEANAKAALVDFVGEGRYHCGLGSAPVHISEALVRARAAAARAATVLARTEIESEKTAVTVSTRLCSGCGLCVEACPFGARVMNPETAIAEVMYDVCHGCGICASVCPNGATQQQGFEKGQIMAVVNKLF